MNPTVSVPMLMQAFREWISPGNTALRDAVDRTLDAGLFGHSDIEHQLIALHRGCTEPVLRRWVQSSDRLNLDASSDSDAPRRVLCLHAGNLPLAGFQDVIAVLLSGSTYIGKLSRRDPWLLASFLDHLTELGAPVETYSTTLEDLGARVSSPADAVMFSGSADSVPVITATLEKGELVRPNAPILARMSSVSVFHDQHGLLGISESVRDSLIRAMMLHGGQGCRSVGVVVTPVPLEEVQCALTDAAERFLLRYRGLPVSDSPFLQELAYERASGRLALWLDRLLLIQREGLPERPGIVHWLTGGEEIIEELLGRHSPSIQAMYHAIPVAGSEEARSISTDGAESNPRRMEPLENAQTPDIDWKPDGIDPIRWLAGLGRSDAEEGAVPL